MVVYGGVSHAKLLIKAISMSIREQYGKIVVRIMIFEFLTKEQ